MKDKRIGRILTSDVAKTVSVGAMTARLHKIISHTALAGTCTITGFLDQDGVADVYILPIGFIGEYDFDGIVNEGGDLILNNSSAADNDKIMYVWEPFE